MKVQARKGARERIACPTCGKSVATFHWAPGYPGLYKHNGKDNKVCPTGYVRPSKVSPGQWVSS